MYILGFGGSPNGIHESTFQILPAGMHDASAVLLRNGEVVAAIEQERLDRLKHSHKRPFEAIRFCLDTAGIGLEDVDRFVFHGAQEAWNKTLGDYLLVQPEQEIMDVRTLIRGLFYREFGYLLAEDQPLFVPHHPCHAMSAMAMSGFDEALVVTLDGQGDDIAGMIIDARGTDFNVLATLPYPDSLGFLYLNVIQYLGYTLFDEYKVMGLAPYGDPSRYREVFKTFYTLAPNGRHKIHSERYKALLEVTPPRRSWEPFGQVHQDIAAALQESLEEIALHILRHYQKETGQRKLCLAGGVAHNCSMNGRILTSGLFDEIFVQPASHDAGCSLGAALWVHREETGSRETTRLRHVYWGTDIGSDRELERELRRWSTLLEFDRPADLFEEAARLLADGKILGWAQGRSEFGPRALGNRSILGDPRPAENKDIINAMVKKREAYRPFAPSVLVERAREFFELPPGMDEFPFMIFTVKVREDKRGLLGAVTHVDGSARIQTVSRETNERYWRLIEAFGRRTGVPVLLNTSFNNDAEPIVDSAEDAVACFLTTQLHGLVLGDYIVRKRDLAQDAWWTLVPTLPLYVELRQTRSFSPASGWTPSYEVAKNTGGARSLSPEMFALLAAADGMGSLEDLANGAPEERRQALLEEALELWSRRLLRLQPTAVA